MVIPYTKGKDQLGKVVNLARGQLAEQVKLFSLTPFSPENLVSRDGFGSPIPSSPYSRLNLVLITNGIPTECRGGVHLLTVHIIYYECSSKNMYILCTMISAALLSCSVSSTTECPRMK